MSADELRAAFRRAAKANHPDNNPDNPEAAERFRKIVRANAILSDGQQRVAYDRLLETARRQQGPKPRRSTLSGTAQRLAADAVASAFVSVVLIGGYLLYKPADRLPLASARGDRGIRAQAGAGSRSPKRPNYPMHTARPSSTTSMKLPKPT